NRLKIIYSGLSEVINKYSPTIMSIEDIFFAKNAKSAIKLGQARGVAVLAAAKNNLLVSEYSPTQIKLALTGKGRANKAEIQKMLLYMLDIKEFKNTDESDAVAIAICHINLSKFESVNGVEIRNNKRRNKRFKLNDIIT
ncbi:MAG: crossover junction endodeoxyribonuclease RuvC, partial [Candidatus Dadabacteria bacterium]|nr:crossover junction endodeoxyribonuclease RuvC [Candidatus Dadabacteria bacterium]NIQ14057.1 crossover junction endodeoxyribonuclease RuvC [Candidatus Dadabacteria bacterium]